LVSSPKLKQRRTPFLNIAPPMKGYFPEIVSIQELTKVNTLILELFPEKKLKSFPLAGRLQYFLQNWKKITSNPEILNWVSGLDFHSKPYQLKPPYQAKMSKEETSLISQEVKAMLGKGAIQKVTNVEGQFLSNLFLVPKKDGGNRPVINLKSLNSFIPYLHFKMKVYIYSKTWTIGWSKLI